MLFAKQGASDRVGFIRTRDANDFDELVAQPREWVPAATLREWNQNWALPFRLDPPALALISSLRVHPKLEEHFAVSQGYIPYRLSDLVKNFGSDEGKADVPPPSVAELFGVRIPVQAHAEILGGASQVLGRQDAEHGFRRRQPQLLGQVACAPLRRTAHVPRPVIS